MKRTVRRSSGTSVPPDVINATRRPAAALRSTNACIARRVPAKSCAAERCVWVGG